VTDEAGHRLAILIAFEEWEVIVSRLEHLEPSEETVKAMEEGREPSGLKAYKHPDALWTELESDWCCVLEVNLCSGLQARRPLWAHG